VADDELVLADILDLDAMVAACDGVAAVVHLAAQPAEAEFRSVLLPRNLDGVWAVFEAAVQAGVPRVVFASTIQTVQGYPADVLVGPDDSPRPISVYGATKLFGESLGRFHADHSGLGVACLRLGAVRTHDDPGLAEDSLRGLWCGARDLARLIVVAARATVPYATVHAVSPPATGRFDTVNPFGWAPEEVPDVAPRRHSMIRRV
jgi:uronate dehydrogenase